MIPYFVFLVVAVVAWLWYTSTAIEEAFVTRDPQDIKHARLSLLVFFLLPLYPALVVIALVVGPIYIFRRLGRINKEETQ